MKNLAIIYLTYLCMSVSAWGGVTGQGYEIRPMAITSGALFSFKVPYWHGISRWISASTSAWADAGGTLGLDSGVGGIKTTTPPGPTFRPLIDPRLGIQPASEQIAWSCPANKARSNALFGGTIPSKGDWDVVAINSCPANGRRSSTSLTFSSSGRKRLSVRLRSFFSACKTRSLASCTSRLFSSRKDVSTRPDIDPMTTSATTPMVTSASPKSLVLCRCGNSPRYADVGKNRARLEVSSIIRPIATVTVAACSHAERESAQASKLFLISVFGIPRRRRRSFGLIPLATCAFWALVFWIFCQWK